MSFHPLHLTLLVMGVGKSPGVEWMFFQRRLIDTIKYNNTCDNYGMCGEVPLEIPTTRFYMHTILHSFYRNLKMRHALK